MKVISLVSLFSLVLACLGFLSPANRGALMTCAVVLWVLLGTPAGYVSSRFYKSECSGLGTGLPSHVAQVSVPVASSLRTPLKGMYPCFTDLATVVHLVELFSDKYIKPNFPLQCSVNVCVFLQRLVVRNGKPTSS